MSDVLYNNLLVWTTAAFSVVAAFAWLTAAVTVLQNSQTLRYAAVLASVVCAAVAGDAMLAVTGAVPRDFTSVATCGTGTMMLVSLVVCYRAVLVRRKAPHTPGSKGHVSLVRR